MFPFSQPMLPVFWCLYEADQRLLRLCDDAPIAPQDDHQGADKNSSVDDPQLSAEAVKKLFDDLLCPPALSHYGEPYPAANPTNTQFVPYDKDAAKATTHPPPPTLGSLSAWTATKSR